MRKQNGHLPIPGYKLTLITKVFREVGKKIDLMEKSMEEGLKDLTMVIASGFYCKEWGLPTTKCCFVVLSWFRMPASHAHSQSTPLQFLLFVFTSLAGSAYSLACLILTPFPKVVF